MSISCNHGKIRLYKLNIEVYDDLIKFANKYNKQEQNARHRVLDSCLPDFPDGNTGILCQNLCQRFEPKAIRLFLHMSKLFSNSKLDTNNNQEELIMISMNFRREMSNIKFVTRLKCQSLISSLNSVFSSQRI